MRCRGLPMMLATDSRVATSDPHPAAPCRHLQLVPSLLQLSLHGNPITSMSHFRQYVVSITQCLRGVAKQRGLQWLDGDVTIDDRVSAGHRYLGMKHKNECVAVLYARVRAPFWYGHGQWLTCGVCRAAKRQVPPGAVPAAGVRPVERRPRRRRGPCAV